MKELIFSGVQPTGNLHLGNYLGAIKEWVKIQDRHSCLFCVVDLHAITLPQNPEELKENSYNLIAAYIACGIDPEKSPIFIQSSVAQHAELAWILSCHTPMGWLNRMTQFKEKAGKHKDKAVLGLYSYPVLMAADILLYDATHVPVGEDQKQHLELTREIAFSINHRYGQEIFTVPEPMILSSAKRVMSLKDGSKKMSKSDASDMARINLTDCADDILKKFRKATSDSYEGISYDVENRPEASNLLTIFAALSDREIGEVAAEYANSGFAEFKKDLADLAVEKLSPITQEYNKIKSDRAELEKIAATGRQKAAEIAQAKICKVKDVLGLNNG